MPKPGELNVKTPDGFQHTLSVRDFVFLARHTRDPMWDGIEQWVTTVQLGLREGIRIEIKDRLYDDVVDQVVAAGVDLLEFGFSDSDQLVRVQAVRDQVKGVFPGRPGIVVVGDHQFELPQAPSPEELFGAGLQDTRSVSFSGGVAVIRSDATDLLAARANGGFIVNPANRPMLTHRPGLPGLNQGGLEV